MISIIYKCADKTLPFKFIGVALCLLKFNSQWKMHHCVLRLVISLLCVLCKPIIMLNTFTIFYVPALNYSSPPTHFTRAPPSFMERTAYLPPWVYSLDKLSRYHSGALIQLTKITLAFIAMRVWISGLWVKYCKASQPEVASTVACKSALLN